MRHHLQITSVRYPPTTSPIPYPTPPAIMKIMLFLAFSLRETLSTRMAFAAIKARRGQCLGMRGRGGAWRRPCGGCRVEDAYEEHEKHRALEDGVATEDVGELAPEGNECC
jgi:hypothetical protein